MNPAGFIDSVLSVIVAGLLAWCARELITHGRALAILVNEITPQNNPSLRQIVADHDRQIAILNDRVLRDTLPTYPRSAP